MNTLAFTLGEHRSQLTLKISTYPVSYTHLDVYKRQALRLPTPMCMSTAATSGADNRPEVTHGGCLWNEMNYAPL